MNYYNEIDPFAVKWLKVLIERGLIPNGVVDDRSISDVEPKDLAEFNQCHFFAGIGGWSRALELASWPSDRPVWTGSCPCQPLSCAGQGKGESDERHLWPIFYNLIRQCRPVCVFGEQVASKLGLEWLAGVHADLEDAGYSVGAADMPAACVGSPHIRQRLFWVADSTKWGNQGRRIQRPSESHITIHGQAQEQRSKRSGVSFWSNSTAIPCADGKCRRVPGRVARSDGRNSSAERIQRGGEQRQQPENDGDLRMADTEPDGRWTNQQGRRQEGGTFVRRSSEGCVTKKHQPEIEPALFPLADGFSNRVGALRGAGNAIVPQVAAEFIKAFMEIKT